MINWNKKKDNDRSYPIQDTLFGDMPISAWTGNNSNEEPWVSFQAVEKVLESDNTEMAAQRLLKIIETPNLESRHYIQAWHFLRLIGVNPPEDITKEVYGVIVEVTMKQGVDIVAAYADHTARYFNYSGAAVIWDNPDDSLKPVIDKLLAAGKSIIHNIGPWEDERPGLPPPGQARISMLTPSGLHFGQGPLNALANDEKGGPIIKAAIDLMQALIKKREDYLA